MRFFPFPSAPVFALLFGLPFMSQGQASPDTLKTPRPADISKLAIEKTEPCAQPFGLRVGQNLEYQVLDAKGKLTSTWRYRVLTVSTDTSGKKKNPVVTTSVRLKSGHYDLANRVLEQQDLTYRCRRDTVYTDGLSEINYNGLKSFRDRLLAFKGKPLAWPLRPQSGSALPSGGAVVQVSSPSVAIAKVETNVKQRKAGAGLVSVTVPVGTFSCYTVESLRELATAARADLVLKNTGREVDYYAPTMGIVKTEYYDKGGKLLQSKVLSKH